MWVRYRLKMARKKVLSSETCQSIFVLRNEGYSMREIDNKLKTSNNAVYYSLHRTAQTGPNQNRMTTTEQEGKYIRVSSLRNRRLTSPQLAASLNGTLKKRVSTSTVKRWLRDAGLVVFGACDKCNLIWYTVNTLCLNTHTHFDCRLPPALQPKSQLFYS